MVKRNVGCSGNRRGSTSNMKRFRGTVPSKGDNTLSFEDTLKIHLHHCQGYCKTWAKAPTQLSSLRINGRALVERATQDQSHELPTPLLQNLSPLWAHLHLMKDAQLWSSSHTAAISRQAETEPGWAQGSITGATECPNIQRGQPGGGIAKVMYFVKRN